VSLVETDGDAASLLGGCHCGGCLAVVEVVVGR
jgi:hypothetical protein